MWRPIGFVGAVTLLVSGTAGCATAGVGTSSSPVATPSITATTKAISREAGAKRRLTAILAKYPGLSAYVQTDPRGASLYIGADLNDTNYNRGIAVYR